MKRQSVRRSTVGIINPVFQNKNANSFFRAKTEPKMSGTDKEGLFIQKQSDDHEMEDSMQMAAEEENEEQLMSQPEEEEQVQTKEEEELVQAEVEEEATNHRLHLLHTPKRYVNNLTGNCLGEVDGLSVITLSGFLRVIGNTDLSCAFAQS